MKIRATLLTFLVLLLANAYPQESAQWHLPENVVARLGEGRISEVRYSPDGARLAVISTVGVWLYDTAPYRAVALLAGQTGEVTDAAFSPDSTALAGSGTDGLIRLWDAETGELKEAFAGHTDSVYTLAFSPDGKTLAAGSSDGTIRLWDAMTWEHQRTLTENNDPVLRVRFSPDGSVLASVNWDKTVLLWKIADLR